MTWFADLSRWTYATTIDSDRLLAVGWLEKGRSFSTGSLPEASIERLFSLLRSPLDPWIFRGFHDCDLCGFEGHAAPLVRGGLTATVGQANLLVPGEDAVLVAPSMIVHYVLDHAYRPPDAFLTAIERCPMTRGPEYVQRLMDAGPRNDSAWERDLVHAVSFHAYLAAKRRRLEASGGDSEDLEWLREAEPDPSLSDLDGWNFLVPLAVRVLADGAGVHDAAHVLGAIGPAAKVALPALESALGRETLDHRQEELLEAIERIRMA